MAEFICGKCGETFEKGQIDEEALEEMHRIFGDVPPEDQITVCDDCWRLVMFAGRLEHFIDNVTIVDITPD